MLSFPVEKVVQLEHQSLLLEFDHLELIAQLRMLHQSLEMLLFLLLACRVTLYQLFQG